MEQRTSRSIAKFATKFCNELGTNKSTICSPLSAEIVLALLALGCKNQSHKELLKALDFPNNKALTSSFAFLTSTLKSIEGATLNVANKVYVKEGGELKPDLKKVAEEVFESGLEQLDFNESHAAASVINKWVAQKTNHKITDMISPEMLNERIGLVLVNAIYFQGTWAKPFPECYTRDKPFHLNSTTTILVPQMTMSNQSFKYGISKALKARLLEIPYEGGEASMVIVLPDEIEGLNSVLQKLASGHDVMADIKTLKTKDYFDITIPKFKVETTIDLKQILPKLGIKSIFDEAGNDIDLLTSDEKLYVSKAIQKALIVVDEKGTEAAACFSMFCQLVSAIPNDNFEANRPFVYFLIARKIPIFIGVFEGSEYAKN